MEKELDVCILEFCRVAKGVDERIDKCVLHWFGHIERMRNNRIAKRIYVGESEGIRLVGRLQKWIDCFKNKRFAC